MVSGSHSGPFEPRQERLCGLIEKRKLQAVLISNLVNIFYLTGFQGSAGLAAFGSSEGVLWVDPRYTLQAREQVRGVEVIEEKGPLLRAVARWIRRQKAKRVGYEDSNLTCSQFRQLEREASRAVGFVPAGGLVEQLRAVKGPEEIEQIREACKLTARVFEEVLPRVKPGVRESDLAIEIEFRMKRKGADRAAFETIVASGARAALPHARASRKLLGKSELVVLDLGAILGGYASDMTRTLHLGKPSPRVRGLYSAVREAQQRAVEAMRAGALAGDVDQAARRALERRGLGGYFTHSTGHGVGLEIHERPRLARKEKTRLESGCVVTAEPGVYFQAFGGIRIEDTVLVGSDGPEILTPVSKDNWVVG